MSYSERTSLNILPDRRKKKIIKLRCRGERWHLMKHSLFFSVFICPLEYTGNSVQRFQKCPHWRAFSKTFEDRFHLIRARATPQNNFPFSKDPDAYVWIVSEFGECFVCCKVLFQQADKFDPQKITAHEKWDLLTEHAGVLIFQPSILQVGLQSVFINWVFILL